jgi:hypothetical protein
MLYNAYRKNIITTILFQIDLYDSRLEFSDFKTECTEKVKFSKLFHLIDDSGKFLI